MNKTLVLLLILVSTFCLSLAQERFKHGQILLQDHSKKTGLIQVPNFEDNVSHFLFKEDQNQTTVDYTALQVIQVLFDDDTGFASNQFDLDIDKDHPQFAEVLITGVGSLFYVKGIYYLKKGDVAAQLNAPYSSHEAEMNPSKGLAFLLSDCSHINQRSLSGIKYSKRRLSKLIYRYNTKCFYKPVYTYLPYSNSKEFYFSVASGVFLRTFDFPNLKNATSPSGFQIEGEVTKKISKINRALNAGIGLKYQSGKNESNNVNFISPIERTYTQNRFNYSEIRLSPHFAYWLHDGRVIYNFKIGGYYGIPLAFSSSQIVQHYNVPLNEVTSEVRSLNFNSSMGIVIGLGLMIRIENKQFIKAEIVLDNGKFNGLADRVRSIEFKLGYVIEKVKLKK